MRIGSSAATYKVKVTASASQGHVHLDNDVRLGCGMGDGRYRTICSIQYRLILYIAYRCIECTSMNPSFTSHITTWICVCVCTGTCTSTVHGQMASRILPDLARCESCHAESKLQLPFQDSGFRPFSLQQQSVPVIGSFSTSEHVNSNDRSSRHSHQGVVNLTFQYPAVVHLIDQAVVHFPQVPQSDHGIQSWRRLSPSPPDL